MALIIGLVAFLAFLGGIALFSVSWFWPSYEKEVKLREEDGSYKTDKYGNPVTNQVRETLPGKRVATIAGIVLAVVGFFLLGVRIIEPGTVGVVVSAGNVNMEERAPGINWVTPFIDDIKNFPTRVIAFRFDDLGAASSEYQDVFIDGVVNYHINPTGAAELYVQVGDDFEAKLVRPFFTNLVKEVVPQYRVNQVLGNREAIRQETVTRLQSKLTPYGLLVDDIALEQIDFNPEYNEAIKQKQIEQERILTEQNILEQRKVQAQQAEAEAKGRADAAIEEARGRAQAVLLERNAEAEGNRLVAESLTEEILRQRGIDKFNPNVRIILMPADSQDFIFPPSILEEPAPSPAASPQG